MSESNSDPTAARRALDAFLVDNQELEQLTARLSAFNLFDVLRIADVEIRHSNVLAWLLTPGESHGLGMADGHDGFWGRWQNYMQTGHGGNVALNSRDPSDYQVSILEVAGTAASHEEIARMESQWKAKLQSREMGLNRN